MMRAVLLLALVAQDKKGGGKWDVIHFNWGLHDLRHIDGKRQVPVDAYEKNLRELGTKLKEIQKPANVHFNDSGSRALAGQVAAGIRTALEKK